MKILWADEAWQDYLWWERNNKKIREKINTLIEDIGRHPFAGLGKPEPLKKNWTGYWSRRITKEHRLTYKFEKGVLLVAQCRYHY
ncbi:MAG: Txe/YoeB family addiction module toxin [Burkholderiales bacterium]